VIQIETSLFDSTGFVQDGSVKRAKVTLISGEFLAAVAARSRREFCYQPDITTT